MPQEAYKPRGPESEMPENETKNYHCLHPMQTRLLLPYTENNTICSHA